MKKFPFSVQGLLMPACILIQQEKCVLFLNSRLHFQEIQFKVLPVHLYQPGMWNPFFWGLKN